MKWLVLRFLKREESSGPKLFNRKGGWLSNLRFGGLDWQATTNQVVLYVGHFVT